MLEARRTSDNFYLHLTRWTVGDCLSFALRLASRGWRVFWGAFHDFQISCCILVGSLLTARSIRFRALSTTFMAFE